MKELLGGALFKMSGAGGILLNPATGERSIIPYVLIAAVAAVALVAAGIMIFGKKKK